MVQTPSKFTDYLLRERVKFWASWVRTESESRLLSRFLPAKWNQTWETSLYLFVSVVWGLFWRLIIRILPTGKKSSLISVETSFKTISRKFWKIIWRSCFREWRVVEFVAKYFSQATVKPQYVEQIAKSIKGKVHPLLLERIENDNLDFILDTLGRSLWLSGRAHRKLHETDLNGVLEREVKDLSGGELQRFAIGVVCIKKADV